MSDWGRKMKQRASAWKAAAGSKATNQYPLRRVVKVDYPDDHPFVLYEYLECGHYQLPRSDMFGQTNANRRRCRRCHAERLTPPA